MDLKLELSLIQDSEILSLTEKLVRNFPEKFWYMPASSTGKYHSETSQVRNGLVIHTKSVVWAAKTIMDTNMFDVNRDVVIAACILHDGWKYGNNSNWTLRNHAAVAVNEITRIAIESHFFFDRELPAWYTSMLECIASHNGKFTKEWTESFSQEQIIVHVADMIGSRKFFKFDPLTLTMEDVLGKKK